MGTYAFEQRLGFGGEGHVGGEGEGGVEDLLVHDVEVLRVEGRLHSEDEDKAVELHYQRSHKQS
jgi:hypothetical protein